MLERRTDSLLLARFAENMFWLARYMERAENLARIIDVNNAFAQNERGEHEWLPIVALYADHERFFAAHDEANANTVLRFYLLDRENPNALVSIVQMARENARSLRHLISTETWTQLNVVYNWLVRLRARDLALPRLSGLCRDIRQACQLHTGVIEGTGYRDSGWHIYQLGKYLERLDQTTRLVDINYHHLLPSIVQVGTEVDVSRWNALLRSLAAYHAFRRIHPRGMTPELVAGFLLFDRGFQRSVTVCLEVVEDMYQELRSVADLTASAPTLRTLIDTVEQANIEQVIAGGLHEYLDEIQRLALAWAEQLGAAMFGHEIDQPALVQSQS